MLTETCNSAIVLAVSSWPSAAIVALPLKTDTNRSLYALEFRCTFAAIQVCMGLNLCG